MGEESSALVNFLSDPATLVSLGVIAAGTAYYLSTRPAPMRTPFPIDKQSLELTVSYSKDGRCSLYASMKTHVTVHYVVLPLPLGSWRSGCMIVVYGGCCYIILYIKYYV